MLALINTNRMAPPVAPLGVEYVAAAARAAGEQADVLDLCLADRPEKALADFFATRRADLVGLSFRNVDDCFWPSAQSFLPELLATVRAIRSHSDAPIVLGGVGYSILAAPVLEYAEADFGIRGDGEAAVVALLGELRRRRRFDRVGGLLWRHDGAIRANRPAWPGRLALPTARDAIDNAAYFRLGGQGGVETKRGCPRKCLYCADPLAKGPRARLRAPGEVADEVAALLAQGVDVLHLCDGEFNLPRDHALAVCRELTRRGLGRRVRWYAYLAVTPFDAELAEAMARAGCAGINFTGDSAAEAMLAVYRQPHRAEDLAEVVALCRRHGIATMIDLLLGGPGETPRTVAATIETIKRIDPDCAGAALGLRICPGTGAADLVAAEGPLDANPTIRRRYAGPVDLLKPTFYISTALGEAPARLVRDLIAGDGRFFEPMDEPTEAGESPATDHNYNANAELTAAIAAGARGAYWHILHRLRTA